MSYKDDEELNTEVDINEDEVDVLLSEEELDDPLIDDDILGDEDLLSEDDEDDMEEFAGLDGSEY
jgi:hypothetical protein